MRLEKEIKEKQKILKEISIIVHPSLETFVDWILEQGDEKEQNMLFEIWKGIYDARMRSKGDSK